MTGIVPVQPKKGYNSRVTGMVPLQKRVQLTGDRYGSHATEKRYNSRVTGVVPVHKNEGEYWNSPFILEKIDNSV